MKDFYTILGIDTKATSGEISEAYVKLSEKFRPDLNRHDSYFENRFREICDAYEVLSDPVKRSRYDLELSRLTSYSSAEKQRIRKYYSRPKGLNIFFTVVLIALTGVFGHYVLKSVRGTQAKKAAPVQDSVKSIAPVQKIKYHRRRHWAKVQPVIRTATPIAQPAVQQAVAVVTKPAVSSAKSRADTVKNHQSKPALVSANHVTNQANIIAAANNSGHFRDDSHQSAGTTSSYTSYIMANETGSVNMRLADYFNADVISQIPDGASIIVLEKGRYYYKIRYDNQVGYVPKWTVR